MLLSRDRYITFTIYPSGVNAEDHFLFCRSVSCRKQRATN